MTPRATCGERALRSNLNTLHSADPEQASDVSLKATSDLTGAQCCCVLTWRQSYSVVGKPAAV